MKKASMTTSAFNRLIDATKAFCSKTNRNHCYLFIRLEFHAETNEVVAVAVDGFRLSAEYACANSEEDFFIYVRSNIKLPGNSVVDFELVDGEAIIRCNGFIFGYKQPDDKFLDWGKVIPTSDVQYKIAFNGDYLLSALQAAKASVGKSFKTHVVLEFRSPLDPIVIRTNEKDVKMVLPIRINDEKPVLKKVGL